MIQSLFCTFFLFLSLTLHAALIADRDPIGIIQGGESLLNHPEGIAFSPSGDTIAIANAGGNNILFYRATDCTSSGSQVKPFFVIGGSQAKLLYPHDLDFSPDGEHLAVANSGMNRLLIYKKNAKTGFYHTKPFVRIDGKKLNLERISAVKYSPDGYLAICDVQGHRIALFRYQGNSYERRPYQVIQGPPDIISLPDGLAFSRDGTLLAVTSHATHSVVIFEKTIDGEEFNPDPVEILKGVGTGFCYTHSLCFHPEDHTLAVSSAGGTTTLSVFEKISNFAPFYASASTQTFEIFNPETIHLQEIYSEEGGIKGVAYSPDGQIIGLCAPDFDPVLSRVLFYSVESSEALESPLELDAL